MDHPVAPYLIAIARRRSRLPVARPAHRRLDRAGRCSTRPRPSSPTPRKWSSAAEKLYGPYRWGRYDLLVLPPAFPFGGMENPTLTFLTPTFIAGDKSLVSLVAHELAHSWSGNLVTNATWADCWLNEGFTTYFENRIMEAIYGPRSPPQEAALSFDEMNKAFAEEGGRTARHAAPSRPERGRIPTAARAESSTTRARSSCARSKGSSAARQCDAYLRSYFDRHAFQPMTSARFLADMREKSDQGRHRRSKHKLQLDHWVYQARPARQCRAPGSRPPSPRSTGGRRLRRRRRPPPPTWTAGRRPKNCASSTSCRARWRRPRLDRARTQRLKLNDDGQQ